MGIAVPVGEQSMQKSFGRVAWECFVDLGVTIVYATIAGLLIVGIVATDDGASSILQSMLYASLLPISVAVLIGLDVMLRLAAERRALRRRRIPVYGLSRS